MATQRIDENRIPIEMRVRLDQREQVGAQGRSRHSVCVACGRYSLSSDQARELASVLLQMAAEAEQVAEIIPSRADSERAESLIAVIRTHI